MPRLKSGKPTYVRYSNGQGRVCWIGHNGKKLFKMLPGPFGSKESLEAYERACVEYAASGTITDFDAPPSKESVAACKMVVWTLLKIATTDMSQLEVDEALEAICRRCASVVDREEQHDPDTELCEQAILACLQNGEKNITSLKARLKNSYSIKKNVDDVLAKMLKKGKIVRGLKVGKTGTTKRTAYRLPS